MIFCIMYGKYLYDTHVKHFVMRVCVFFFFFVQWKLFVTEIKTIVDY